MKQGRLIDKTECLRPLKAFIGSTWMIDISYRGK